jgi:hypothetical protein
MSKKNRTKKKIDLCITDEKKRGGDVRRRMASESLDYSTERNRRKEGGGGETDTKGGGETDKDRQID